MSCEGYQGGCGGVVSHLVYGQDAGADHLGFGGNERGHDQSGAVAQAEAGLHVQSLGRERNRSERLLRRGGHVGTRRDTSVPGSAWCVQEWLRQTPSCSVGWC